MSKKPSVPYTAIITAVSSQLIRPLVSSCDSGMLILNTSFTGLFCTGDLISLRPVNISLPISNPVKIISPGQFSKAYLDAAESMNTLNSLPAGKWPAMETSRDTLLSISSRPLRVLISSGGDLRRSLRLVRNPTVTMVTLFSGLPLRIFLYIFTASGASEVLFVLCSYLAVMESAQCCEDPITAPSPAGAPTGRSGLPNQVFITSMDGTTSSCLLDEMVARISAFPLSAIAWRMARAPTSS